MAVRRKRVEPDVVADTPNGQVAAISRQALEDMALAFVSLIDISGGVLQVVVDRTATNVPQEMVTVAALFEWKDRTDARPQPEVDGGVSQAAREAEEALAAVLERAEDLPPEVQRWLLLGERGGDASVEAPQEPAETVQGEVVGDGLDDVDPAAEDVSAVEGAAA